MAFRTRLRRVHGRSADHEHGRADGPGDAHRRSVLLPEPDRRGDPAGGPGAASIPPCRPQTEEGCDTPADDRRRRTRASRSATPLRVAASAAGRPTRRASGSGASRRRRSGRGRRRLDPVAPPRGVRRRPERRDHRHAARLPLELDRDPSPDAPARGRPAADDRHARLRRPDAAPDAVDRSGPPRRRGSSSPATTGRPSRRRSRPTARSPRRAAARSSP